MRYTLLCLMSLIIITLCVSCKKESTTRKIQYVLYTNEDFSSDDDSIFFKVFIKTTNHTLWDSSLAPMRISEIPHIDNKIIVEKTVPNDDNQLLSVGFIYDIQNVGESWFIDTCQPNQSFKTVNYSFR